MMNEIRNILEKQGKYSVTKRKLDLIVSDIKNINCDRVFEILLGHIKFKKDVIFSWRENFLEVLDDEMRRNGTKKGYKKIIVFLSNIGNNKGKLQYIYVLRHDIGGLKGGWLVIRLNEANIEDRVKYYYIDKVKGTYALTMKMLNLVMLHRHDNMPQDQYINKRIYDLIYISLEIDKNKNEKEKLEIYDRINENIMIEEYLK